jgi:hypothetical protein
MARPTRKTLTLPAGTPSRHVPVFWVQAVGRRPPRKVHAHRDDAIREAKRLSTLATNAGVMFQVRESRFVVQFVDGAQS